MCSIVGAILLKLFAGRKYRKCFEDRFIRLVTRVLNWVQNCVLGAVFRLFLPVASLRLQK